MKAMKPCAFHPLLVKSLAAVGVALIVLTLVLALTRTSTKAPLQTSAQQQELQDNRNPSSTATTLAPAPQIDPRKQMRASPLNELLVEGLNPKEQTEIIGNLLIDYWITHRSLPTGTQEEVYASLSGRNSKGIVYAPREHPSFTEKGFQARGDSSAVVLHVRSSREGTFDLIHTGPDQLIFTADDQVRAFRHGS